MSNRTQIVGRLTADPVLRAEPDGSAIAYMRVAETPLRPVRVVRTGLPDTIRFDEGETTLHDVVAVGAVAMNAAQSLHRGDRVVMLGHGVTIARTGEPSRVEFRASVVAADLRAATVTVGPGSPDLTPRERSAVATGWPDLEWA